MYKKEAWPKERARAAVRNDVKGGTEPYLDESKSWRAAPFWGRECQFQREGGIGVGVGVGRQQREMSLGRGFGRMP